jgi:hypothetical protein
MNGIIQNAPNEALFIKLLLAVPAADREAVLRELRAIADAAKQ